MTQQTIGRYEIRDELGEGGMGTVYLAYDPKIEREVALKVLQPQLFMHDPEYATRFEREVKTISTLQHGSIVSLYDYGEDGEWLYFVMPVMRGGSLRDRLERGPLSLEEANKIIQRIGKGLAKAHRQGIIHRDLKPGNILFDEDGEAYLSDFGIVKVDDPVGLKTQTGQSLGTPQYMSPEQLDGKEIDPRSDVYSLGIIIYEMLTGIKPYDHPSSARVIVMQLTYPLPDILADHPEFPPKLQELIKTAMAKEPAKRYASVTQLTAALQNAVDAHKKKPPPPKPVSPPVYERKPVESSKPISEPVRPKPLTFRGPATPQSTPAYQANTPAVSPKSGRGRGRKFILTLFLIMLGASLLSLGCSIVFYFSTPYGSIEESMSGSFAGVSCLATVLLIFGVALTLILTRQKSSQA